MSNTFHPAGKAPAIETDPLELTDKRLNPEEAVHREREDLLRVAAKNKIPGQAELEDPMRACGARIGWQELIRRIRRCNPDIMVVDSSVKGEPSVALYRRKRFDEYLDSDFMPGSPEGFKRDYKYVGGFPKQPLHEYSTVDIDTSHLPTREHRGWRSVLIMLIKSGAITYRQAVKEFGDPSGDRRSNRWFDQLGKYRFH